MTVAFSTISGNRAFQGGGISSKAGNLTVIGSTIQNNSTRTNGFGGGGGGILSVGALNVSDSTISDNLSQAGGVGILHTTGLAIVTGSTISGNVSAQGNGSGILNGAGDLVMRSCTISGNSIAGIVQGSGHGGGIYMFSPGNLTVTGSTISGNSAYIDGGGIWANTLSPVLSHSIVAGNTGFAAPNDILSPVAAASAYNLIGVNTGLTGISNGTNGNQIGAAGSPIIPLIGPLANNGGMTKTHALLAGSPAINAGDPGFVGPPNYDQRGVAFSRIVGGRIDVGAFEFGAVSANFDGDTDVDGVDFFAWQRGFGKPAPTAINADGDADGDGDVDAADLTVWKTQFGISPTAVAASTQAEAAAIITPPHRFASGSTSAPSSLATVLGAPSPSRGGDRSIAAETALTPANVDAALAWQQMLAEAAPRRPFRPRLLRTR